MKEDQRLKLHHYPTTDSIWLSPGLMYSASAYILRYRCSLVVGARILRMITGGTPLHFSKLSLLPLACQAA